jgi:prepilin-type N-terminal cleavage/methylation domain-containing protein
MRQTLWRIPGHDEDGLTLAEMLLVLAIMALVAGVVVGRGLPGRGAVRTAALVAYVRDARSGAMQRGQPVVLASGGQRIEDGGAGFDLGFGYLVDIPAGGIGFQPDGSSAGGAIVVLPPDGGSYGVVVAPVTGSVAALQP